MFETEDCPADSIRHDPHKFYLNCWKWGPQGLRFQPTLAGR